MAEMLLENSLFMQIGKSLGESVEDIKEYIRTGSTLADLALSNTLKGGYAKSRMAGIFGDESTAKTYFELSVARRFQLQYKNGFVIFDDAEVALEANWIQKTLNFDVNRFRHLDIEQCSSTVEDFEQNVNLACEIAKKENRPVFYLLDSLDAVSTDRTRYGGTKKTKKQDKDDSFDSIRTYDEEESKHKDVSMRDKLDKPAILSGVLERLNQKIKKSDVTLHMIMQSRTKIGVMFGDKTYSTGGKAKDFYFVQKVKTANFGKIKSKITGKVIGIDIKIKVVKNKIAPPFREAVFPLYFEYGIDDVESCVDFLIDSKYSEVVKSGNSYNFGGKLYSRGKLIEYFLDNYKLLKNATKNTWNKEYGE
jgi:RecA/RadA recombinase